MEIIHYFEKEWAVLSGAPVTFLVALLLVCAAAYAAASWRFGSIIESQRAQIELLDRKVSAEPGGADFKRRLQLADALATFYEEGERLRNECRKEVVVDRTRAEGWAQKTGEYLESNLGKSYQARFCSNVGTQPVVQLGSAPDENKRIGEWLTARLSKLEQIMSELS